MFRNKLIPTLVFGHFTNKFANNPTSVRSKLHELLLPVCRQEEKPREKLPNTLVVRQHRPMSIMTMVITKKKWYVQPFIYFQPFVSFVNLPCRIRIPTIVLLAESPENCFAVMVARMPSISNAAILLWLQAHQFLMTHIIASNVRLLAATLNTSLLLLLVFSMPCSRILRLLTVPRFNYPRTFKITFRGCRQSQTESTPTILNLVFQCKSMKFFFFTSG
jgi:hypothetical protein